MNVEIVDFRSYLIKWNYMTPLGGEQQIELLFNSKSVLNR